MSGAVVLHPTAGDDAAKLVIEFRNSEPIDLLEFSASLRALANEHTAHLRNTRPNVDVEETRLLIVNVRKGSIVFELLPVLAPIISTAEVTNTIASFVDHIRRVAGVLGARGGRLPDATTQQLKNVSDTFRVIAAQRNGEFVTAARYQNGETIQEFVLDTRAAREIVENAEAQRRELVDRGGSVLHKVLMRLHQSSIAQARVDKRSQERGIIEKVDDRPRPLIYVSEIAGQKIKDVILGPEGNPYSKAFVVDVDVEMIGGRPRAYRILDVHDIIDLDED